MRSTSPPPCNEVLFRCPPSALHVRSFLRRLPLFCGEAIRIQIRPELLVSGNHLLNSGGAGAAVYGAASIAERRILLEGALLRRPVELGRILTHEIFHFVWVRRSNGDRWSYEGVLDFEFEQHARGELGWPSESVKLTLTRADRRYRSRRWRQYVCESFCDSAAWYFAVGDRPHEELTLKPRFRAQRAIWLRNLFRPGQRILV